MEPGARGLTLLTEATHLLTGLARRPGAVAAAQQGLLPTWRERISSARRS